MLTVISVEFSYCYAECHYSECRCTECRCDERRVATLCAKLFDQRHAFNFVPIILIADTLKAYA